MSNDSRSRRDKREKEKKRKDKKDPKHLRRKHAADDADASSSDKEDAQAEEALAVSVPHLGAKPGRKALDNSLSALASLPSLAEAKDSLDGKMNSSLSHGDSEDSGNLSGDCEEVTPIPRPLSPSQYFGSLMKHSGSREKLLSLAATASPSSLGSTPLSLSTTLPLRQDSTTGKEEVTDSDLDRWVRGQNEWAQQRLRRTPTVEAGKPTGSPKPPAGSSSFPPLSSVDKQATARQVAAELIRQEDLSLSSSLVSASRNKDNLLPLQVNNDLEDKGQRMPVFTEDQRVKLQKRKESSSSVQYESVKEHALSNERKQKELQDLQDGEITEEQRKESKARRLKAAQDENAKCLVKKPPATRPPRSTRVASLDDLPLSFAAEKSVMDMQYCVKNLAEFHTLAGKNKLSKFSDFWAPGHRNTTPMKPAFTPENLMTDRISLLARFYNSGQMTADGEADQLKQPALLSHLA
jgi:hypothetical protein